MRKTNLLKSAAFIAGLSLGLASLAAAGPAMEYKEDPVVDMVAIKKAIADLGESFDKKLDAVREGAEKALKQAETGEKATSSFKDELDEALKGMNETNAAYKALEQKFANVGTGDKVALTAGQKFINADEFKALAGKSGMGAASKIVVETKTITSLTTDAMGSAGALTDTQRIASPLPTLPNRRLTIRDLLAQGQTDQASLEYVQETGYENNAAMVAEGAIKPESSIKFELVTSKVRKIAHFMEASMEILQDAAGLRSMIDGRLRYMLKFKEEQQLLNGDGTGQNLMGLATGATEFAAAFQVEAQTNIDVLRLALLQASLAEYPADGLILHPTNWAQIETTKDSEGRYIIGNPQGTLSPTLWSTPVVVTQAQGIDTFLAGSFGMAAQIFDRMDATVMASTEDKDNFRKNLVTILAEERLALAIYRPEAFVAGALEAASAGGE